MKHFENDSDKWLNPLGYTIYSSSNGGTILTYSSTDLDVHKPSITCHYNGGDGDQYCSLSGGNSMKLFITMQATKLQFRHPYIIDWINKMAMYDKQIFQLNNE